MKVINNVVIEDIDFDTGDVFYNTSDLEYYILVELDDGECMYGLMKTTFEAVNPELLFSSWDGLELELNEKIVKGDLVYYSKHQYDINLTISSKKAK